MIVPFSFFAVRSLSLFFALAKRRGDRVSGGWYLIYIRHSETDGFFTIYFIVSLDKQSFLLYYKVEYL